MTGDGESNVGTVSADSFLIAVPVPTITVDRETFFRKLGKNYGQSVSRHTAVTLY